MADAPLGFDTICLHGGYDADPTTTARAVPIYRTGPFQFKSTEHAASLFALKELGNIYTRLGNPTNEVLEKRVAMLEGAHPLAGLAVASGTNANFYAIINLAQAGDNIVSSGKLYGGTYTMLECILPQFGITTTFVDASDPENFKAAINSKTRCIFTEGVSNPALEIVDLEAIAAIAKEAGLPLVVDSTFCTPYLQQPLKHGATIVTHSLTKWLSGHGTHIGGIVIDGGTFDWAAKRADGSAAHPLFTEPDLSYGGLRWGIDLPAMLAPLAYILRMRTVPLRNLGGCISPDNSWQTLIGIETLSLRMERHCANALAVAHALKDHDAVDWVRYPGLESDPMFELNKKYIKGKGGAMVVFGVKGGVEAGKKFIDSLKLVSHVANVGDARTLAIHPATTTHSQLSPDQMKSAGVAPELVRLSIGIENVEDILGDISQALAVANA